MSGLPQSNSEQSDLSMITTNSEDFKKEMDDFDLNIKREVINIKAIVMDIVTAKMTPDADNETKSKLLTFAASYEGHLKNLLDTVSKKEERIIEQLNTFKKIAEFNHKNNNNSGGDSGDSGGGGGGGNNTSDSKSNDNDSKVA
ncbi:unnamed protein product [Sympodiomycopsis kandeliae]